MHKSKKTKLSYGICCLVLVLLYSLLMGCQSSQQEAEDTESASQQSSQLPTGQSESPDDNLQESEEEKAQSEVIQEDSGLKEASEETTEAVEEAVMVEFEVQAGEYLTEILTHLVEAGWGSSAEELLNLLEQMDRSAYRYWGQIQNAEERAFAAEGYIAPGIYTWEETATAEEVLRVLLCSWEQEISQEMEQAAADQGYTMDEVLIMASIVEWESSFDPYNIVKPNVAAVVRNRIESDTALQMDVTIFYLQDALEPHRDPEVYEEAYDTYIRSTLPAGPIGSPSIDSIQAVLAPADTNDLFFVYDEDGNYYFAEDYDQHLANCELAGIL